jgi:hypothetical protein
MQMLRGELYQAVNLTNLRELNQWLGNVLEFEFVALPFSYCEALNNHGQASAIAVTNAREVYREMLILMDVIG